VVAPASTLPQLSSINSPTTSATDTLRNFFFQGGCWPWLSWLEVAILSNYNTLLLSLRLFWTGGLGFLLCFLLDIIQKQETEEESFKAVPLHSCLALHPLLHLSHGARVLLEPARLLAVLADHLLVHLLL